MTEDDIKYLKERLHSPEMHCRQCDLTRRLINEWYHERDRLAFR